MIHNNQDLIKTIKKILEVFPDGIIIQSYDAKTQKFVVKFANNSAAKEIINSEDSYGKPVDDNKLSFDVKYDTTHHENASFENQNKLPQDWSFSELLQSQIQAIIANKIEASNWVEFVERMKARDEDFSRKFFNVKTQLVKWENNPNSYIHIFNNTSTLKKFETEKARNECIQLMLASISHEFRTPINAFSNSLLLLESNYQTVLKKLQEPQYINIKNQLISQKQVETDERFYKICKISTTSLMCLVEDILDLAKIEAGTFSLNEQPFSICSLVKEIEYIFEFQWTQKGITFDVEVDHELIDSTFWSDMGRIKQVLINLISNAYKFTMKGGIILQIKPVVNRESNTLDQWRFVKFTVIDTGIGIHEKEIPKLFKLFGMVNQHRNNINSRGSGLGLSISKKIVESLGGIIKLKSKLDIGTNISFTVKEHQNLEFKLEINRKCCL